MIVLLLFLLSTAAEAKVDHGKLLEVDHEDKSLDCKAYDYAVILMADGKLQAIFALAPELTKEAKSLLEKPVTIEYNIQDYSENKDLCSPAELVTELRETK